MLIYTLITMFYPFDAHCCHMGTAIMHPVPDRIKSSSIIFDIRALWRSAMSQKLKCPDVKNYTWWLNPVWHRILYSCTHKATMGVKGLYANLYLVKNSLRAYEGRSKSSRPDLVLIRIKLKYYLLLIVAMLRTRHAQYDLWAIKILCILVVVSGMHMTWKNGVTQCNEMTILTDSFVPLHALLFRLRNKVLIPMFHPE